MHFKMYTFKFFSLFHLFFYFFFRPEKMVEVKKEPVSSLKKADRERIRRDKLNEQFLELGNALGIYLYQHEEHRFFNFY